MRELSLNVLDIVQNSIVARATLIQVTLAFNTSDNSLEIRIVDNGCGMTEEQAQNVQSPFYTTRTTRKVGLGVPLFKMAGELTGGSLSIDSRVGEGTALTARFKTDHIDMTPVGDIGGTILLLVTCNPDIDFRYEKSVDGRSFHLDTRELREILGEDMRLSDPDIVEWIREYLEEQEAALADGA